MKKLGLVLATAVGYCLTVAVPALAKYPPTVQGEHGGNAAGAAGGAGGGGSTAFTGADVSLWMVLLAVLVVGGIAALIVSRRRAGIAE